MHIFRGGTKTKKGLRVEFRDGKVPTQTRWPPPIFSARGRTPAARAAERNTTCTESMASMRVVAGCARALRNPKVMWLLLHEVARGLCASSSPQQLPYCCCGTASKMHFSCSVLTSAADADSTLLFARDSRRRKASGDAWRAHSCSAGAL